MSVNQLLREVKNAGEDYEWYPTTNEIIKALREDIFKTEKQNVPYPSISILDIGAGNGKVLSALKDMEREDIRLAEEREASVDTLSISEMYAIEKSQQLIGSIPDDIFVLGVDFWQQTLVDKKIDVLFSNPPYSEYSTWSEKIIKEGNSKYVYLVIPTRWKSDKRFNLAIEKREATVEVVGTYTFEDSEDRKARAEVDLLKITLIKTYSHYSSSSPKVDPFELWFEETYSFKEDASKDKTEYQKRKDQKEEFKKNLVGGASLIERLEELYLQEMTHLHTNYLSIASLDADLLKQLNVSKESMMEAMKLKIEGLKNLYWEELFDNLDTITSRLTSGSRKKLLEKLRGNTSVDFGVENAYAVVIWVIKTANKYYDSQLVSLYKDLSRPENIRLYKSNTRVIKDDWRYLKDNMTHYALDYRIVMHFHGLLDDGSYTHRVNGLSELAVTMISDMTTVARNLGFSIDKGSRPESSSMTWESQAKNNFYFCAPANRELKIGKKTIQGKITDRVLQEEGYWQYLIDGMWMHENNVRIPEDIFVEIKAFKNGNIHLKYNQKFMKALNIANARINKWVKSPKEASEEFDITEEEAMEYFDSNFKLTTSSVSNLLPLLNPSEEVMHDEVMNTKETKEVSLFD